MEQYDLHLIIEKRCSSSEYYPVILETAMGERHNANIYIPPDIETRNAPLTLGTVLGTNLYNALTDAQLWPIFENSFAAAKSAYSQGSLLFEIQAPELYPLPWENIFDAAFLTYLSEVFTVVRYLSKPSSIVVTPLQLPIDVLIVADSNMKTLERLPTKEALQYFRATKSTGVSASQLRIMISRLKYDIVHITGRAEFRGNQANVLFPGLADSEITLKELRALLKRCGARLLILHCIEEAYGALLNFAHNIQHSDGPTIIVTCETPTGPSWSFNDLYFDVAHDFSLVSAVRRIPRELRPALLVAAGGADVLRISPVPARLYAQIQRQFEFAQSARGRLAAQKEQLDRIGDVKKAKLLGDRLNFLDESFPDLGAIIKELNQLNFMHESGALQPMTQAEIVSSVLEKRLKDASIRSKRVVNSWFRQDDRIIDKKERLQPDTSYNFEVQIGIASDKSNVRNAVAIPEEELARFYSTEGITLRIVLFSSDFKIEQSEQFFTLPPPPCESNPVGFNVKTPSKSCVARMRVCIYFEQNLLQSLLVQAVVGESKYKTNIKGNVAEVDFCLSNSLTDVDHFPSRTLNIAVNNRGDGTHSFYIAGSNLKRDFDFGEGEISSSVKEVRDKLQHICSEKDSRGNMRYRYGPDNRGNEQDFMRDVTGLAELGSLLYSEIITHQERAFQDHLTNALGKSEATIQVSSTKSAKYVFPWALVYDKPLVQGKYDVCPQFLADLRKGTPPGRLKDQQCIKLGCPHEASTGIICPSGFWGYKHIIEQPLSLEAEIGFRLQEIPMEIKTKGPRTSMMMGISLNLRDVDPHLHELEAAGNVDINFTQSKQQIGIGLQRKDLHLIYFYCHGGRKGHQTWLGVGKNEMLFPRDLIGWRVNWPTAHPLVFINGCGTVDVTPDDFVDFNKTLSWCEAAGVMGTEITIPESLARHFATGFLQRFLKGFSVGVAIRDQRLTMLENYNLLGLAYTPYCSANLRLVH